MEGLGWRMTDPAIMHHGRIIQDGQPVAGCSAPDNERMLAELRHYAAAYSQDGPVEMQIRSGKGRWRKYD